MIVNYVVDNISEEESFIEMKKDTVPEDAMESDDSDFDFEKIKQSKKRKRDI